MTNLNFKYPHKRNFKMVFSLVFSLIASTLLLAHSGHQQTKSESSYGYQFKFIKNQGQFNSPILYKAKIPSGDLFVENNRLVYDFKDLSSIGKNHSHGATPDPNWRNKPIQAHCFYVNFINSNSNCSLEENDKFEEFHNYFLGNDKRKWAANVPLFGGLNHKDLYPSIDMHSGTKDGKLKFEFLVKVGGNPNDIELEYEGLEKIQIKKGELYLNTSLGEIVEEQPYAYQIINGQEVQVNCTYSLVSNKIKFNLPNGYNADYELIIDPTLIFSTYSGSFSDNFGVTATYDSQGYLYSGSLVFGAVGNGYPTTPGAYQTTFAGGAGIGGVDINISKYDTTGTKFIYSTYLGGNEDEMPHSLVVNSRDELYIFGTTSSQNFPTDSNSIQQKMNNPTTGNSIGFLGLGVNYTYGTDLFVFKLSSDGKQRLASTFLGGSSSDGVNDTTVVPSHTLRYNYADEIRGEIDIDKNDNIYVATCTYSSDFPMVGNSFDTTFNGGGQDGIIIKMTNNLDSILWSSYLGGSGKDAIYSLAIDHGNNIYVAGGTTSRDTAQFKTGANKNHLTYGGGRSDGFLTKITADGSTILGSTYYGTTQYDQIYFVELDKKGFVYIYGQTEDTTDFYLKDALYGKSKEGVFITKLSAGLDTTHWSTLIGTGGSTSTLARPQLAPSAFLVDVCNSIYFSGWGGATNNASFGGFNVINNNLSRFVTGMDTTSDAYKKTSNGNDFYLGAISSDASFLQYGSFYGGNLSDEHVDGGTSRFDKKGIIYQSVCAGCGGNSDFPILPSNAVSPTNKSTNCNNAVFKMDFKPPSIIAEFQIPNKICLKDSVTLKNLSKVMKAPQFYWKFGNGDSSTEKSPKVFYTAVGTYNIQLVVIDTSSCNYTDTITKKIIVEFPKPATTIGADSICLGSSKTIGTVLNPNHTFNWSPGNSLDDSTKMNPIASPTINTLYKLEVRTDVCVDTFYQYIEVDSLIKASLTSPDSICAPDSVTFKSLGFVTNNSTYQWKLDGTNAGNSSELKLGFSKKGNYKVMLVVTDPLSCNLSDSMTVDILTLSDSIYNLPNLLSCNRDNPEIGISAVPGYQYRWIPSYGLSDSTISNPNTEANKDVNYQLIVDRGVCMDTVYQQLMHDTISVSATPDTNICTTTGNIHLQMNSYGLGRTFQWSNNIFFTDTIPSSISDSTITPNSILFRNVYYAKTTSSRGCVAIDSSIIRVDSFGIRADSAKKICLGDTIQISVKSLIPNDTLSVLWSPYQFIIGRNDTSHILVNPPKDKLYKVAVENKIRCLVHDSVFIEVSGLNPRAGRVTANPDTIIKNNSTELNAFPKGFRYNWTPNKELSNPTSDNTFAAPDTTTTYQVEVTDPNNGNCKFTKSITIAVEEIHCEEPWLFIPNSFSPNGDGNNDVFYFRGRFISEFNLKVFNRWGELLFETNDVNQGWDGSYKGKQSQADVYVYQVSATCINGENWSKKGDVTLIR